MIIEMIMRIIGMRTIIEMAMMVMVTGLMVMMMVEVMTMIIDMLAKMGMVVMVTTMEMMMMTVCTSAACAIGFSSLLLPSHLPTFLRSPRSDDDEYKMM